MTSAVEEKIKTLPSLPLVVTRMLSILEDPRSSVDDLERVIRYDQSLTAKILAVSNSAYYSFHNEVTTVARAVVTLGYTELRNLCLSLGLMRFLSPASFKDQAMAERLWLHSVAVAEGAKIVAKSAGTVDNDQAFTAGLLHDLGKVVLAGFFPDEVNNIAAICSQTDYSWREAEQEVGLSHEEVGRSLAEQWRLPPVLIDVIGGHHTLIAEEKSLPLVAAVHVSDYLSRGLGFQDWYLHGEMELNPDALAILEITADDLSQYAEALNTRREAITALFSQFFGAEAKVE